jgi:type 1 glutamine amidotransferase
MMAQTAINKPANYAKAPRFKALIYYTTNAEIAHVQFATQTVEFFKKLNYGDGFILDVTTSLDGYDYEKMKSYDIVIMPDGYPMTQEARDIFQKYMENGGGWMGFHSSAYNDESTHWPWLVQFLGGTTFLCNNWPPQPALVNVDDINSPVTKNLPSSFVVPASEFYQWKSSPRLNKNVKVFLTISKRNYPMGVKDIVNSGDFPIVWTNTRYRMIYLNMGHGDEEYTDASQKLLFINAFKWVLSQSPKGNPFEK